MMTDYYNKGYLLMDDFSSKEEDSEIESSEIGGFNFDDDTEDEDDEDKKEELEEAGSEEGDDGIKGGNDEW
jgi:hypothetical protein